MYRIGKPMVVAVASATEATQSDQRQRNNNQFNKLLAIGGIFVCVSECVAALLPNVTLCFCQK